MENTHTGGARVLQPSTRPLHRQITMISLPFARFKVHSTRAQKGTLETNMPPLLLVVLPWVPQVPTQQRLRQRLRIRQCLLRHLRQLMCLTLQSSRRHLRNKECSNKEWELH